MEYVSHPWINENAVEKRAYQESVVKTAISDNSLIVLPTGLGKTNIAVLVAAHRLSIFPEDKIMFLAPTRPLVEQHCASFARFLKLGPEMKVVTGHTDPGERAPLYQKADIVFSTPQTVENDIKTGLVSLRPYSLLVIDEAHHAVGNYAYPFVAKAYMSEANRPLILALTASPGSAKLKLDEVKQKLFVKNVEVRMREDADVRPYVQNVDTIHEFVDLPVPLRTIRDYLEAIKNERMKKLIEWRIVATYRLPKSDILKLQSELAQKKTGFSFAAMSVIAEVIKLDHALMLLETQSLYALKKYFDSLPAQETKAVARLLKDDRFKNAMRLTVELLGGGQEHPKISRLKEIVAASLQKKKDSRIIVFVQYRDTISKINEILRGVQHAAPIEFIGQAKKKGKGLTQKEQVAILNEFRMGFYNVLIASQIGEEGLDIEETDMVIFYEPTPSAIRKIQRAGRTARTRPGKVIMLIARNTRDEAYHWAGFQKEKKMARLLFSEKQRGLGAFR